ncbi:MAG: ferritin [Anaerolineales bacterium]|jgi:ferritin
MFNEKVMDAMNEQIKNELYSAYIYLSMAAHFEAVNLPGFAHWMRMQSNEEVEHAMKFFDFINERGGRVELKAIDQPPIEWGSPLEIFETALGHEQKVTGMINNIFETAVQEKDYPSQIMLQWFIDEQVEEEKSAGEIVETLKMFGEKDTVIMLLDRQLGERAEE